MSNSSPWHRADVPPDAWGPPQPVAPGPPARRSDDKRPPRIYPNAAAWVKEWLSTTYRRDLDSQHRTWCRKWSLHPEARVRIEAMWTAWEYLRLDDDTGMSVWFRDHGDVHMPVLFDLEGPFKGCTPDEHQVARLVPLPVDEPEPGVF